MYIFHNHNEKRIFFARTKMQISFQRDVFCNYKKLMPQLGIQSIKPILCQFWTMLN
jgi:hypothetical protein